MVSYASGRIWRNAAAHTWPSLSLRQSLGCGHPISSDIRCRVFVSAVALKLHIPSSEEVIMARKSKLDFSNIADTRKKQGINQADF
jgi:hypothetical protein